MAHAFVSINLGLSVLQCLPVAADACWCFQCSDIRSTVHPLAYYISQDYSYILHCTWHWAFIFSHCLPRNTAYLLWVQNLLWRFGSLWADYCPILKSYFHDKTYILSYSHWALPEMLFGITRSHCFFSEEHNSFLLFLSSCSI